MPTVGTLKQNMPKVLFLLNIHEVKLKRQLIKQDEVSVHCLIFTQYY